MTPEQEAREKEKFEKIWESKWHYTGQLHIHHNIAKREAEWAWLERAKEGEKEMEKLKEELEEAKRQWKRFEHYYNIEKADMRRQK